MFQIRCYAGPYKSQLQLLSPRAKKSNCTVHRGFQSEASIQRNNLSKSLNGVYQNKSAYIDSLCKTFDLAPVSNLSAFNSLTKIKKEKTPTPSQEQQPCKKCAKIRNSVKKFFRAKFETDKPDATKTSQTSLTEQSHQIRMHIFKDHVPATIEAHESEHSAVLDSHPVANSTVCFGCEETEREPSTRGPPIISPVCHGNISASPLGECKNPAERVKKIIKIDRPRSVGGRKRIVDKEQPRETSVFETKKPRGQ